MYHIIYTHTTHTTRTRQELYDRQPAVCLAPSTVARRVFDERRLRGRVEQPSCMALVLSTRRSSQGLGGLVKSCCGGSAAAPMSSCHFSLAPRVDRLTGGVL